MPNNFEYMEYFGDHILPWLGITSKTIEYYHSQKFKDHGFDLTKEQWVLLKIVSRHCGVSQNKIACLSNRDKTSLTRLINTMEKKNYIARIPSTDDKRINLLYLTTQGEKILNETEKIMVELLANLQKNISEDEIKTTIEVMKKIIKNIENNKGC